MYEGGDNEVEVFLKEKEKRKKRKEEKKRVPHR